MSHPFASRSNSRLRSALFALVSSFVLACALAPAARAQAGSACNLARAFCSGNSYTFPAQTNTTAQVGPNYGCLGTPPNPTWFFLRIGTPGSIILGINQVDGGGVPRDVNFICWGPFTSAATPCTAQLVSATQVACSSSTSASEVCAISSATSGEYYLLMLSNVSNVPANITLSQIGGTGTTIPGATAFSVGTNKDLQHNAAQSADGIDILLEGSDLEVTLHYDGYPGNLFANFAVISEGPNTRLRWTNPNNPVSAGTIAHVGFGVPGNFVKVLGVYWMRNGALLACGFQCVAGTHNLGTTGSQIEYGNDAIACQASAIYVSDTRVEWHATEVPLADMNPNVVRNPIRTDVLGHMTLLIPPSASTQVALPTAPPAAHYGLVHYLVSDTSSPSPVAFTEDFVQFEVPVVAVHPFCAGDGLLVDHTTPCPCGNTGAVGNGCGHSFDPNGANLSGTGSTANDDVVLQSQFEPAASFTLFMQHDAADDRVFHDGTLCANGALIRLRGRIAVAGQAFFPNTNLAQDATTTLSQRGAVAVGSGATRYYAAWFRNASTTFCPPATANVTNGGVIIW